MGKEDVEETDWQIVLEPVRVVVVQANVQGRVLGSCNPAFEDLISGV